jgi:LacI family transcriptional regulator
METLTGYTGRPVRRQVAEHVKGLIRTQHLRCGDRLPTYEYLCEAIGASYVTVKRAMDALEVEGIVRCIHGKGTFVVKDLCRQSRELSTALVVFPFSLNTLLMQEYAVELARGVLGTLEERGNWGRLYSLTSDGLLFADRVGTEIQGILLAGVENDSYLRMVASWGTPVVALDYCSDSAPIDFVACDNRAAARRVVEHLVALGHRRIAYLGGAETYTIQTSPRPEESLVQNSSDKRERREGVCEALAAHGLTPGAEAVLTAYERTRLSAGEVEQTAARWFADKATAPTAVVASDESCAEAMIAQLGRMGLRVPEDVSVCAVACAESGRHSRLTHCRFDFAAMGRKGVELLRERCRKPGEPANRIHRIGFEWVEGSTCVVRGQEAGEEDHRL